MESNNFEEARMNFLDEAEKLLQQNMLPQALNLAKERLRSLPVDVDAHVIVGNALIGMGQVNEARDILREVEEIISGLSLIYDRMGDIYRKKGFHQDAAICYEKFIALNPNAEKAREVIEKMALLEQEDRPVAEVDILDDNGILKPDFFTVTLAELYIKQGYLQVAAGILKEIIKREPQNLQAVAKLDTVKTAIALKSSARGDVVRSDHLAETLTRWLENIDRLKKHAAEK
jgi:tetratricopeptide (TPR) repeat protein